MTLYLRRKRRCSRKKALKEFLENTIPEKAEISLYTCWAGDENIKIKKIEQINTEDIVKEGFEVKDFVQTIVKPKSKT